MFDRIIKTVSFGFLFALFSFSVNALSLIEIKKVEDEIRELPHLSDLGLNKVPGIVVKLNKFEVDFNSLNPLPNDAELLKEAIFSCKNALANHVNQAKLYSVLQQEMIDLSEGTSSLSLVQKSIMINILLAGPTAISSQFYSDYINSDEAGGIRLRETLMYFTLHPKASVKSRISLMADESVHPIFRGPASWAFGKLSAQNDPDAIAQLSKALNQSIGDDFGFDSKLLTLLGLAEIADFDYIKSNYSNVGLGDEYLAIAERYIKLKRALSSDKDKLIELNFNVKMGQYERDEAIKYILENNKTNLLSKLGVLSDLENGTFVIEEVSQLASILGYRISGSSDNPVITAI
ncbi:hypothetical protein EXT48_23275 [Pseudoalteromonas sp. CO348]|uniref:hypothetical protein n=1 Tax=unclassified Pseudoalteromonas TaxID=194690 RepID=UPI00102307E1|nr:MULTISPECIES: hypothetical protein [unclassified Pseudoalteromonas]MCG7540726.1 hypothetical protein [Pseudoalteromonas sp. OF7H-1]RZF98073.1 hypothetical protein EXT48_23275 [Pseudoalteromonas sp. CO348]